ncbi:hypothetical protein G6F24_016737 [Rhizopus arrhizus]|nr:hypothetical protein G6F24_016737 [Rhizopus arrhizus]
MADRATVAARKEAKVDFQRLTAARFGYDRSAAYAWLEQALGIAKSICHFAMFTADQAQRAGEVCRLELGSRRV